MAFATQKLLLRDLVSDFSLKNLILCSYYSIDRLPGAAINNFYTCGAQDTGSGTAAGTRSAASDDRLVVAFDGIDFGLHLIDRNIDCLGYVACLKFSRCTYVEDDSSAADEIGQLVAVVAKEAFEKSEHGRFDFTSTKLGGWPAKLGDDYHRPA